MKMLHSLAIGLIGLLFWTSFVAAQDVDAQPISSTSSSASIFSVQSTSQGSVVKIAGQALFFEGLSESDARHVYNSIVYGGLLFGFASKMLQIALHHTYERERFFSTSLLKLAELGSICVPGYYALANIKQIIQAGDWYYHPHAWRYLRADSYSEATAYKLATLFLGISTVWESLSQLWSATNTQYIRVPLTGSASRKFFISARFASKGVGKAVYTLTHTGQREDNDGSDVFSRLSRVLTRYSVDFLVVSSVGDHRQDGVKVTFYDAQQRSDVTIQISQKTSYKSPPWLLQSLYSKQDRTMLRSARFALSPSSLVTMADALEEYFEENDGSQGSLEAIELNRYLFMPTSPASGQVSEIKHESGYSDFVMGNGELVARWADGYLWPDLQLLPAAQDHDLGLTQWWIPEWIGHLLVAEIAARGRTLAAAGMRGAIDEYVVPRMIDGPMRRIQYAPMASRLPIRVDERTRFEMRLIPTVADDSGGFGVCATCQDELDTAGSYTLPCCRQVQLCEDCQQTWARHQVDQGNTRISDGLFFSFFREQSEVNEQGLQRINLRCMIPSCHGVTPTFIRNSEP